MSLSLSLYDSLLERRLGEVSSASLGEKTRRLLEDVKFLRLLLRQMEALDPVTFASSLELLRASQKVGVRIRWWELMGRIMGCQRSWRAMRAGSLRRRRRPSFPRPPSDSTYQMTQLKVRFPFFTQLSLCNWELQIAGQGPSLLIEEPPKWAALSAVMAEIRNCQAHLKTQQKELQSNGDIRAEKEPPLSGAQSHSLMRCRIIAQIPFTVGSELLPNHPDCPV